MASSSSLALGPQHLILAGTLVVVGTYLTYTIFNNSPARLAKRRGAVLPPGPERAFLLGNLLNFPKVRWFETFSQWREQYGDVIYISLAGKPVIVLNSMDAAVDLMDKRMNMYASRPYKAMTSEVMGAGWTIVVANPGPHFNEQRKVFRRAIGAQSVTEYDGFISHQIEPFLLALQGTPDDVFQVIMSNVGALIVKAGYGEKIYEEHGEQLARLNRARSELVTRVFQQFWAVDVLPALRHIPPWFPGANFRRIGEVGKFYAKKIRYMAFELVEKAAAEGNADESVISKYLNDSETPKDDLRDAVAMMYSAGADTTSTSIINFFYGLLANPDAQRKIHEELDAAIGEGRSPSLEEIQQLEYFNAAWKESKRLNPPAPLGLPHVNSEEDVWKGYYIPKGSTIFCNIGFMLRDPRIWGDDSDMFKPERFLPSYNPRAKELPDMSSLPFGFGRRICPGRFFAERVGLQFAAAVASMYEILPVEGDDISQPLKFDDSVVRRPSHFRCQFRPRH